MPITGARRKRCAYCNALFPTTFEVCPNCRHEKQCITCQKLHHVQLEGCPHCKADAESEDSKSTETEDFADTFNDDHNCLDCGHVGVCVTGRMTIDLASSGWFVTVTSCSQFVEEVKEEQDVKPE